MEKEDLLLEQWKMASELHRHEDNLIWQRFSYFVALTTFLVSGLSYILAKDPSKTGFLFVTLIFSVFGSIISFVFASVFKRAYLYHLHRIKQATEAEEQLQGDNKTILLVYQALDQDEEIPNQQEFVEKVVQKIVGSFDGKKLHPNNRFFWRFAYPKTNDLIFSLSFLMGTLWSIAGVGAFLGLVYLLLKYCLNQGIL
ncbi:MAG: hypothetical protein JW966_01640 [Anaerolineae bacterium]|nr:hypothetical protein [Anaerolineae bacterium]